MRDLSMWLKLRNQKCSHAFQASILVKLRINCRSWRNGSWSITHYCVYPWPFPYRGARDGTVVRALASHQCGPDSNRGVDAQGWVCGWFSPLLREVFLRAVWFSPLLKNHHFQIPILYSKHGYVFSWTPKCFVGKEIAIYKKMFIEDMISLHLHRWARFSSHREKICYCYYKYYFSCSCLLNPLKRIPAWGAHWRVSASSRV